MKKYLFGLLLALALVSPARATLTGYYREHGQKLPSIAERRVVALDKGFGYYDGTKTQNIVLERLLRGDNEPVIGVSIPTVVANFEDSLATRITATQTSTFTLVKGYDKLSRNLSGYYGFIMDEGSISTEEYFLANCSGTACTIIKRGIDVVDGSSQTTTLQHEHRRGAIAKITNFPQLAILSRLLNGQETFDNFPRITTSTNVPTSSAQFATKYYVDSVGAGGMTCNNVSTTLGLKCTGSVPEKVGINASSTTGGAFGLDGSYYQKVGASRGIDSDSNGLFIATSTSNLMWGGTQTFSTTTIATSTITTANITSSTIGQLNILGQNGNQLLQTGFCKTIYTTSTAVTYSAGNVQTIATTTLAGGLINTSSVIHGRLFLSFNQLATSKAVGILVKYGSSNVTSTVTNAATAAVAAHGFLDFYLIGNAATNAQNLSYIFSGSNNGVSDGNNANDQAQRINMSAFGTGAVDSTLPQNLSVQVSAASITDFTNNGGYIEYCPQR